MRAMLTKLRIGLVLGLSLALQGCGVGYVAQAASGQMGLLAAREPIDRVIADKKTTPELRQRLVKVREARAFAIRELGLPDNKSYRSYADLEREYVVWAVVATGEFSVEPREWCFPIVGCVAYRGYFKERRAERYADRLRVEGHDVVVNGVPAYSTLGNFNDPILSTMMTYGDDELASIMFHELSHQLIYIRDDTAFNEAFAVAVEEEGLARWLRAQGREGDLERHRARRLRQGAVVDIIAQYREELAALYRTRLAPEAMRERKAQVFARLRTDVEALDAKNGVRSRLAAELAKGPNNARLASLATYHDCVAGFEALLAGEQHDLPRFYAAVRELAELPREARRERLCKSS
jgi:predicted aminopeptidase